LERFKILLVNGTKRKGVENGHSEKN